MPKKRWRSLLGFSTSILSQNFEKIEGGKFFFRKKVSHSAEKVKVGPFSLTRYCMLRGKKGKTFLILFAKWLFDTIKFCRTILVTSGVSEKTLTKSHDYSRLFSRKAPTKKTFLFQEVVYTISVN